MIKYISGILIGIWFTLFVEAIIGTIGLGIGTMIIIGILVAFLVGVGYVIDMTLEYKNLYKNTINAADKGMKLWAAWSLFKKDGKSTK